MRIEAVALRRVSMPLVRPFRTSFGVQTDRDALLVRVRTPEGDGWGECVAMADTGYSSEFVDGAQLMLRKFLAPRILAAGDIQAGDVGTLLAPMHGHRMAKAALEMAVLDIQLKIAGRSFGEALGAVKESVECGVSIGIPNSIDELIEQVDGYLADGYRRIKLKVEPGWDVEPVAAVRKVFGDELLLQVDANTAYTLDDAEHLAKLDPYNLLLMEQPLPEDDFLGHARLAKKVGSPICLDESIRTVKDVELALELGACEVVNIKAGRVGGYLNAVAIHDLCYNAGIPVWCGGMLETGLGRAANVALAALPGFTLPGDTSASDRYFTRDITEPFVMHDGLLDVPRGPGLGVTVDIDALTQVTTAVEELRPF